MSVSEGAQTKRRSEKQRRFDRFHQQQATHSEKETEKKQRSVKIKNEQIDGDLLLSNAILVLNHGCHLFVIMVNSSRDIKYVLYLHVLLC